ncbi:MAG: hypothetical protein AAGA57_04520, partial [Planctomycetota bacterium]
AGVVVAKLDDRGALAAETLGPFNALRWRHARFGPGPGTLAVPVKDQPGGPWRVLTAGMALESRAWTDLGPIDFLHPSGRPVYPAFAQGQWRVMAGDEPVGAPMAWIESPVPAPAGDRVAWWAREVESGRWALVVDGAWVGVGSAVRPAPIRWSADASTWAVVVDSGSTQHVAHAFGRDETCEEVAGDSLTLSPIGGRVAYAARQGERWFVVLDGRPGPGYAEVDAASLRFSPDGSRLIYAAKSDDGDWRLHDAGDGGRSIGTFAGSQLSGASILVSPTTGRIAALGAMGGRAVLLVDGEPAWAGDGAAEPVWSPDGERLGVLVHHAGGWRLWVEGRVSDQALHDLLPGSKPWFDLDAGVAWVYGRMPPRERAFGRLTLPLDDAGAQAPLVVAPTP